MESVPPAAASIAAIQRGGAAADFIHFAGHARFDPYDPRQAEMILADGKGLGVDSIASNLFLERRPVVTLLGCETGVSDFAERGEESIGLSSAWLAAGAQVVIGALWKVSDGATSLLAIALYRQMLAGARPDAALEYAARTIREMSCAEAAAQMRALGLPTDLLAAAANLSDLSDRPFAHPYFWSGFITVEILHLAHDEGG